MGGFSPLAVLDPYMVSLITFCLVTINTLIEVNYRLIELGAAVNDVSRGRLIWFYFSATFSYIVRTVLGMFVIFVLITVIIVVIIGIFSIVKSSGELQKGTSKEDVLKNMSSVIIKAISKYIKIVIDLIYTFLVDKDALIGFLVIFPVFMLIFMFAYGMSLYQPVSSPSSPDNEDGEAGNNKSSTMITFHHYLYFLFVVFLMGTVCFILYQHYMDL